MKKNYKTFILKKKTLIIVLKNLQLQKLHQLCNKSCTIFIQTTNKDLIYLNIFLHMNFSSKVNKINKTHCNWFHQNHLQYDTHSLNEYKIPKIPIIQNYTLPSQINYLENYAVYSIFFMVNTVRHQKRSHNNLGCNIKNFISNIF
jgi:hypothetical protein